jgi:glycosyltransferase involved in cell wall biosynthesis
MKVAVVTPYYREPIEKLRRCHDSVMAQTRACTHFMVADGFARDEIDDWDVQHIRLPLGHADFGNTPRCLGALSALNQGFDGFAYLDADNWYHPEHAESLVEAAIRHDAASSATGL